MGWLKLMGRVRHFGRVDVSDPASMAGKLPAKLRCLDRYVRPGGSTLDYREYQRDLAEFLEGLIELPPDKHYAEQVAFHAGTAQVDFLARMLGTSAPGLGRD
jgi:hypothetical protein